MYSNEVADHFHHPRNVGSLPTDHPDVGTGFVEAPDHGDVTRLQVRVNDATGVIDDTRFKTFGCGFAIASASLASEWIKGRTLNEALAITPAEIAAALHLSPAKVHCSELARGAIQAAITDYRSKQARRDGSEPAGD